jgi:hypothetical protein
MLIALLTLIAHFERKKERTRKKEQLCDFFTVNFAIAREQSRVTDGQTPNFESDRDDNTTTAKIIKHAINAM